MHTRSFIALSIGAGLALAAIFAGPANAETAPDLACGTTITVSCSETAHFDAVDQWMTPLGAGTGCPSYVADDFAYLVGSGNGIEHDNINKAGDFWATTTFTGQVTITFYAPDNVIASVDDQGDVTSATVTGPPDATLTGHFTQWFGVSDNKQNGTFGLTFSFEGADQAGNPVSLHGDQHANWTPGTAPFAGPPHHAKYAVSC
jgi:hypothetical protein